MSCFNSDKWIAEAIQSVLSQSFTDFEFIIVNDGSTDNTLQILNHFMKLDSRILVLSKSHTGLADSLNYGLKKARGNWIARIDADDICEPLRIEKQYNLAVSNSNLVYIASNAITVGADGRFIKEYRYPSNHKSLISNLTYGKMFPAHSSAFLRLDAVRLVGCYRKRIIYAQDADLWFRLLVLY